MDYATKKKTRSDRFSNEIFNLFFEKKKHLFCE